jgi:hypothetical protein
MHKSHKNILMLQEVATGLHGLVEEVVFVGGATTALYIDDEGAPESVPSDDVDFVVEVTTLSAFAKMEEKLRKLGFKDYVPDEDEVGIICRKKFGAITVDVMPSGNLLGFTNEWYPDAVRNKLAKTLPNGQNIYIFSIPYFLASKLVAFRSRGGNDMRFSQDMEDILSVIDGNRGFIAEMEKAPEVPKKFIQEYFVKLLKKRDILEETVSAFIKRAGDPPARVKNVMTKIDKMLTL